MHVAEECYYGNLSDAQKQYEIAKLNLQMVQNTLLAVNETGDKLHQRLECSRPEKLQVEHICKVSMHNPFVEKQDQLITKLGMYIYRWYNNINGAYPCQSLVMTFQ